MAPIFFIRQPTDFTLPTPPDAVFYSDLSYSIFFKAIVQAAATEIAVHLIKDKLNEWNSIFSRLRTHFPDLKINIYTDSCLFSDFADGLKSKTIYSCCFGISQDQFQNLAQSPQDRLKLKHVLFKDSNYCYTFLKDDQELECEILIVLMPAWNNFFPPYGIAHIAGTLEQNNLSYDVLDLNNLFYRTVLTKSGSTGKYSNLIYWQNEALYNQDTSADLKFIFDKLLSRISEKTKYIGFSLFGTTLLASQEAMKLIRKTHPHIKLFCGGPHGTITVVKSLIERNMIDAAIMGEGEESVIDLIQTWKRGESPLSMPGVILNINGLPSESHDRNLMDINKLPKPNFDRFPIFQYERHMTLPIYSSRGCVAKCSFCSETIYWKKFRAVSPENIVAMMEDSIRNYGINTFYFNDSLMNGSHKLLSEMCDLIISKGLVVKFEGYSRFDSKLTPELLAKMAKAGCILMLFGFESGSQKIIDLMNKKVFVENYESILQKATEAGIACQVCIIVGFPGETWADFFSTLFKVLHVRHYIAGLNLSIMEISRNSLIEKDFEKYNIVNSQNRYWRTKNWTNFFLLRLTRYLIFKFVWRFFSGKGVSTTSWNPGYLMIFKKLSAWFKMRYLQRPTI